MKPSLVSDGLFGLSAFLSVPPLVSLVVTTFDELSKAFAIF
jgi:hypothetical protein